MPKRIAAVILLCAAALLAAEDSLELVPKRGRGTPPSNARGEGPWATRIMLATSTNGLDFQRLHFVLSDQAGVPNVIVGHDRRARVYYIDFGNGNILACAVQKDVGSLTNWIYRRVNIAGLSNDYRNRPVDPAAVTLADGRYRVYFMHAAPLPSICSAISSNGVDFVKEEGVRFAARPESVFDPIVLKTETEWLLWCGPDGRFSARSPDGLGFTPMGEFRVEGVRFMPWSVAALPNKAGYRLYGNFLGPGEWSGGVSSAFSWNGRNWKREPGIRLSLDGSRYALESRIAPDNGCTLLPDGRWLMVYLATIPAARGR